LKFAALAAQKHRFSPYLMSIYGLDGIRDKFEPDYLATGNWQLATGE